MKKSESIMELTKALLTFHIKVDQITKDAKNPFFKSSYATLQNIQESIRMPLIESGLTVCQFPDHENGLTTIIMHESGEWIESTYYMAPVKNDPQGIGSCITYQRRYALCAALNLSIGDLDDDGNMATHGKSEPESAPEKKWLNKGEMFDKIKAKLDAGQTTMEIIEQHFRLSKEIKTLLTQKPNK